MFTLKFYRTDEYSADGDKYINKEFIYVSCHNFKCAEIGSTGTYIITVYKEPLMMLPGDGVEYRIDSNEDYSCYMGCYIMNPQGKTVDHYLARTTIGGIDEENK